mgnify:CR=1 FL=1
MKSALLLSGGMDSIAVAYWQRPHIAITIDYGQKPAAGEIRAAEAVAAVLEMEHHVIHVDMRMLGSGDLAGTAALGIAPVPEWWPFRNQMLITLGAMRAVTLGVARLLIGVVRTDARRHADGTPSFVQAMDGILRSQEGRLALEAPAIGFTAPELVRESGVPSDVLAWAHSCHVADYACGMCRGCQKHYETLQALGFDPY